MYSNINKHIKDFLTEVLSNEAQVGYFGDFSNINLNQPAILIEPKRDTKAAKNIRWKSSDYQIKIWILSGIDLDYETSMIELEKLIGSEEDQSMTLYAALDKLQRDPDFAALSGSFGGKQWRVLSNMPLTYSDLTFGITQRSSRKINTATLDIVIHFEQEK